MTTVVYTNVSSTTVLTGVKHGNISLTPGGSVTLSSINEGLDSLVSSGSLSRVINGVLDNITSDDNLFFGSGGANGIRIDPNTGVPTFWTTNKDGLVVGVGLSSSPLTTVGLLSLKGGIDCSTNPLYPAAIKGDTYFATSSGKIGGPSGKSVGISAMIVAYSDSAGGTDAAVGTNWMVLPNSLAGAVLAVNNLADLPSSLVAWSNLGGDSKVRSVQLTGLSTGIGSSISPTDTLVSAFGKLQAQLNNLPAPTLALAIANNLSDLANVDSAWANLGGSSRLLSTLLTGLSTAVTSPVASNDSILSAMGKLQGQISSTSSALSTFVPSLVVENVLAGAPYNLVPSDKAKIKRFIDTAPQTVTVTTVFSGMHVQFEWPVGTSTIVVHPSGVMINGSSSDITLSGASGIQMLIPTGTNSFDLISLVGPKGDTGAGTVTATAAPTYLNDTAIQPGFIGSLFTAGDAISFDFGVPLNGSTSFSYSVYRDGVLVISGLSQTQTQTYISVPQDSGHIISVLFTPINSFSAGLLTLIEGVYVA